jgi:hypothetical protein
MNIITDSVALLPANEQFLQAILACPGHALLLSIPDPLLVYIPARSKRIPVEKPELRLEDMQSDIDRLIASIAFQYTDDSCVFLHRDELEAECRAKFAAVYERAIEKSNRSRAKFFGYLKAALKNHVRSRVQKYRFTQKRTGVKPPDRKDRFNPAVAVPQKPTELSLDDPDTHLSLGDEPHCQSDAEAHELTRHVLEHCTGLQRAVFEEMTTPSLLAFNLGWLDSHRGKPSHKVQVKISRENMAEAVGISMEQFEKTVLEIKHITMRVVHMKAEEIKYDGAVTTLATIFGLQVAKASSPLVVRRMLTLAAHDQADKVTAEVADLLETIGAKVPKYVNKDLSCFGILYQAADNACMSCGIKESCAVQAANVGLGEITISPKLLGAKVARTPYVVASPPKDAAPVVANVRDMEIIDYLYGTFHRHTYQGELYLQPTTASDKQKFLVCIGRTQIPLRVRLCNPSPILKKALVQEGKNFYIPDQMGSVDAIDLIQEHAKNAYAYADAA